MRFVTGQFKSRVIGLGSQAGRISTTNAHSLSAIGWIPLSGLPLLGTVLRAWGKLSSALLLQGMGICFLLNSETTPERP